MVSAVAGPVVEPAAEAIPNGDMTYGSISGSITTDGVADGSISGPIEDDSLANGTSPGPIPGPIYESMATRPLPNSVRQTFIDAHSLFSRDLELSAKERAFFDSLVDWSVPDGVDTTEDAAEGTAEASVSAAAAAESPAHDFAVATPIPLSSGFGTPFGTPSRRSTPAPATTPSATATSTATSFHHHQQSLIQSCRLSTYNLSTADYSLLTYFITEVLSLLFVDKTSTTFLRTVVPLALLDPMVRAPVLAIAASHRANSSGISSTRGGSSTAIATATATSLYASREATIYRAQSQAVFIAANVDYFHDSENGLLAIVLVAIGEIFEGTSLYWSVALEKAAQIIDKRGGLQAMVNIAPLAVQLFCYLDLVASLSTCSAPHVDNPRDYREGASGLGRKSTRGLDVASVESILNSKFGFKFGIAGELFKVIGNISTLASLRDSRYRSELDRQRFETLANLIEMKLQSWEVEAELVGGGATASPATNGTKRNGTTSTTANAATNDFTATNATTKDFTTTNNGAQFTLAVQWAAFLRLHQVRHGYDRSHSHVRACLEIILLSIKAIAGGTAEETGLMFPLIMAGLVAEIPSDRHYILTRIQHIKHRLRFTYIGEFEKLLKTVWGSDEGRNVNWAKIRYYEFLGLVMF